VARKKPDHVVTRYAKEIVNGKRPACKLHILACQRHLDDLKLGKKRGIYFDENAADHAIDFFRFLNHSKGKWAGTPFQLEDWQKFVIGCIFGWLRTDGLRRFRTVYEEIPRKNGKSTKLAGVGLYLFIADGEGGAEIYAVATKKDQAKIVFLESKRMVQSSPSLRKKINILNSNLNIAGTANKFEPLGSDEDTMDGLNTHGAIIDEVHAHKTRGVVDVMQTSTGAREQPLIYEITTSGFNKLSVCWEHHEYSEKVLEGIITDDSWFAFITSIDKDDDWTSVDSFKKANPNYGISVNPEDLLNKCKRAQEILGEQNSFKRLHLNVWTEQASRWIDMDIWNECPAVLNPSELRGLDCYGGLDLASREDVAAFVLFFPELCALLCTFWVPEENIHKRAKRDRVPYDIWADEGYITATEGNVVDYDQIRLDINEASNFFNIKEIAYDRWNATQITTQLEGDGLTMVPFGQGFGSLSAPTKEFGKIITARRLNHGGNPVLKWMASNVAVKEDPAGNLKPDKGKSAEKIDGIMAGVMAIGRAIVQTDDAEESVYEQRGLIVL